MRKPIFYKYIKYLITLFFYSPHKSANKIYKLKSIDLKNNNEINIIKKFTVVKIY